MSSSQTIRRRTLRVDALLCTITSQTYWTTWGTLLRTSRSATGRSTHVNAPAQMVLDETVRMDESSLEKLTTEQTYHRIYSMYHSPPRHCASCEQIYGQYLAKAVEAAAQASNLSVDLYLSAELNISPRPLKRSTKPRPIPREYVTCFGPQANPP